MKRLKFFFLLNDIGFLVYWLITLLHIIPADLAFKDYDNPIISAWNWSFFPLDMCISFTGIFSVVLFSKRNPLWKRLALISLTLTFCSGLQAVSFWFLRSDFDLIWWASNLFLVIYPLFFIRGVVKE
ncbi:MAG TPA: DUF5360 family protein [Clostridia bacterium]|nr:DUF5360 family protein [Clostridia bacterium]